MNTTAKLHTTFDKQDYTLREFTQLITFLLLNENEKDAYWITSNQSTIPFNRVTIETAFLETLYTGFAIIY